MRGPRFALLRPLMNGKVWTIDYYGCRRGRPFVLLRRWAARDTKRQAMARARWLAHHAGPRGWHD